mmetsp:Transcript_12812/g.40413  ORF Transcript_12812/g.40413 Transcript_12812/m.40413 type:complete len:218 (-) Transcript_12812:94-747(-)
MDHHCPYIFNCVRFNNHKFFLLLVVYTTAACVIVLLTTLPEFFYCAFVVLNAQQEEKLQVAEVWGFCISCLLNVFITLVIAPMAPAHLALACRNQTSIEGNYTNMPNPFDQGATSANLQQIFGSYGPDWFFPVPPFKPVTDGVSFSRADETEADLELSSDEKAEDRDLQVEKLWRARYGVRRHHNPSSSQGRLGSPREPSGPLDAISLWWRSIGRSP